MLREEEAVSGGITWPDGWPYYWPKMDLLICEHWLDRLKYVEDDYPDYTTRRLVMSYMNQEAYKYAPRSYEARDIMKSQHYRPCLHPDRKWSI